MPYTNFFGDYYPTRDGQAMAELLGIGASDRVLEVGGGFHQFERADVITDLTFSDSSNRNGAQMSFRRGKKYVECAVEDLPFEDGEFDFVFCSHVLEHCLDPEKAASELSRVARRGFVEMPRLYSEFVLGNPSHRWMVTQKGNKLFFEPRPFVEVPFRNFMHAHVLNDPSFNDLGREHFHNIFNIQLPFEGRLEAEVVRRHGPEDFDYSDRFQAGISHLLFAWNNLYFHANCEYSLCDAFEATEKLPDCPDAWHVLGLYQLKLLMLEEALSSFGKARQLGGGAVELDHNRDLAEQLHKEGRGDVGAVLLPEMEPHRRAWAERIRQRVAEGNGGSEGGETSSLPSVGSGPASSTSAKPLVSILVAGSEREDFLEEALSSAINQSWRPLEIVVVVSNREVATSVSERFELEFPLVVVEVEEGLRPIDLYNRALVKATGEYIGFLGPSDRLRIHHVQRLVEALVQSGDRAGYSDALAMTYWTNDRGDLEYGYGKEVILSSEFTSGKFPPASDVTLTSVLIHRDCLRVVPYLDADLGDLSGVDLLTRISRHSGIRHVPFLTAERRRPDPELAGTVTADQLTSEHRKLLANYSHFEPLELMRRVVELDNVNTYLRSELARLTAAAGPEPRRD